MCVNTRLSSSVHIQIVQLLSESDRSNKAHSSILELFYLNILIQQKEKSRRNQSKLQTSHDIMAIKLRNIPPMCTEHAFKVNQITLLSKNAGQQCSVSYKVLIYTVPKMKK